MDAIEELLTRGVDKIYPSYEEFEKVLRSGKKLRVYQGFDPTGNQLHIGHMAGLMKLRQFQRLSHHVIFLIGDGTGMIGDPSGKSESRKPLTRHELLDNARTYKDQAGKILNFSGTNPAEIKFNSEWLDKLNALDFLNLAKYTTYQQIIERDMFQKRIKQGQDLYANELIYPLLQGYDSVVMDIDLEIGGSDQMFNMLMGRNLMHKMKGKNKFVMTTPLLTDSAGNKIGKTENNVISLVSPPQELFGMIMNLPDEVIIKCFELITDTPQETISEYQKSISGGDNPMKYKKILAHTLVKNLNNENEADNAQLFFEKTFQNKQIDSGIPEISVNADNMNIIDLIILSGFVKSRSEIKRLIKEGAIDVGNTRITDVNSSINIVNGLVLKVGKHKFAKILQK